VTERRAEIDLSPEQLQRAVVEFELVHAACPPPFGLSGRGVFRAVSLGLDGTKVQPLWMARRRTSKIKNGDATAGWAWMVAVVCMVLPRSVVEE